MEGSRISWKGEDFGNVYDSKSEKRGNEKHNKSGVEEGGSALVSTDPVQPRGILATIGHGIRYFWVTREIVQSVDNTVKIRTTLRELIIYIVFLVILCVLTFGMMSASMFYYNNLISNLFLQTQSKDNVNFQGIGTMQDFWSGPLLSGLYPETWYNGQNLSEGELGFVLNENKLLGVPQMRQVRVRNNSCVIPDDFRDIIKSCYDTYSDDVSDKKPFGLMNGTAWTYKKSSFLSGKGYWGHVSSYGTDGFTQPLQRTLAESSESIQLLMQNLWIDRGTRAVIIDFTLYNANVNLFCVVRLVAEFPATGGVIPSWSIQTVKLLRYVSPSDYFVLACEVFFLLFIVYYIIEEIIEIKLRRLAYFKVFWNILDIVVIIVGICCVAFDVYRTVAVGDVLDGLLQNPEIYPDFTFLAYCQTTFNSVLAVMVFCCWVKIFKYISFNKTMTQLSSTLSKCAKDLGGFAVMFFIIFLAFAQLGYLLFGSQLEAYSSFDNSIFTLYRLILGDFDFGGMQQANRVLGPAFFILYVFFVFFILLNMFLAIINDTYSEVKSDMAEQANEFELGEYFKKGAQKMMEKLNIKKEKIVDIQEAMKKGDINNDGILDFDEWRNTMKMRGYADAEIEAVFAKYDTDGDRGLDLNEQDKMENDLAKQRIDVEDEMQQVEETGDDEEDGGEGGTGKGGYRKRRSSVPQQEIAMLQRRVDRMEQSVSSVMQKLDAVLTQLDNIERTKTKRRQAMARLLDNINQSDDVTDPTKRQEMLRIVQGELNDCDEPSAAAAADEDGGMSRGRLRPSSAASATTHLITSRHFTRSSSSGQVTTSSLSSRSIDPSSLPMNIRWNPYDGLYTGPMWKYGSYMGPTWACW